MGLYRVMLVDDEEDVRQAIARKINWEEIGFQVVASAENGQEALELAERLHPDVVMTDTKMPFMDGLTLGRALKKRLIFAYRRIASCFYAHIGAGLKVLYPLVSKLTWIQTFAPGIII